MSNHIDQPSAGDRKPYTDHSGNWPPYPYPPPRRMSKIAKVLLIIGIVGFLGFAFGIGISILAVIGGVGADFASSGILEEQIIEVAEDPTAGKIVVIDLSCEIFGRGSRYSGTGSVHSLSRQFRHAAKDENVKAVILQVDSPGGSLTASDIIYSEVKRFKETGKPVVVSVGSLAASGGYYISVPGDYIVVGPTSMVGSIGVIMNRFEIQELLRMIGVKTEPIKSSEMKDIGSPFRPLTDAERKYFQELISFYHNRFIGIVAKERGLSEDEVRELANGKVYTADQALEYGLIDEIGYFDSALEKARELSDAQNAGIIKYEEPFGIKSFMRSLPRSSGTGNLEEIRQLLEAALDMAGVPQVRAVWNGEISGD